MKQILQERDDIVFFIKLFPLKTHPAAYAKSKAIVCEQSLKLLERAFDGRNMPEPSCETTEVDDNIELAERLGITGTPAIILPDGAVEKGFKDAVTLIRLIESAGRTVEEKEAEETKGILPEAGGAGKGVAGEGDDSEMSEPLSPAQDDIEEEEDR